MFNNATEWHYQGEKKSDLTGSAPRLELGSQLLVVPGDTDDSRHASHPHQPTSPQEKKVIQKEGVGCFVKHF
jgi:hypothetical protein